MVHKGLVEAVLDQQLDWVRLIINLEFHFVVESDLVIEHVAINECFEVL